MRTIDNINDLNKSDFLSVFGNVFEKTESVAMEAFELKPFKSFEDIVFKMLDIYENYENNKILEILNAHPELAVAKKMTSESISEQASAKLNQCSNDEYEEFKKLNAEYKKKFNFPFIIAVKGKDKNEYRASSKDIWVNSQNCALLRQYWPGKGLPKFRQPISSLFKR